MQSNSASSMSVRAGISAHETPLQLKADNISFAYPDGSEVLREANFSLTTGEIVGLLAPSGKGKSTLAKILAGHLRASSGEISIGGTRIEKQRGFNPVQLMLQHPEKAINPRWKMKKVLSESWNPPAAMLDEMGIKSSWLERWPSELSGGELQRFCLLRALAPETRFLIADEMTSMLDMITQAQMWDLLMRHASENDLGIVVISHDDALLERICTRVVRLDDINKLNN